MFDLGNGGLTWKNATDRKEGGLHDRIHSSAHARLFSDIIAIDYIELQLLFEDISLYFLWQLLPDFVRAIKAVEQEYRAFLGIFQHIHALKEGILVTGHKIRLLCFDQIGSADRLWSKAQVRHSHRAGLFRVIVEVALSKVARLFADDLDRVLVCTDGAI